MHGYTPISTVRLAVAATGATGSAAAPGNARALIITAQTANAYVTFDGSAPGGSTGPSHVLPTGLAPAFYPVGPACTVVAASTLGATGTNLDITWLE